MLVPSHQTIGLQAIYYCNLPRVASQFDGRIPAPRHVKPDRIMFLWECNWKSHTPVTRERTTTTTWLNFYTPCKSQFKNAWPVPPTISRFSHPDRWLNITRRIGPILLLLAILTERINVSPQCSLPGHLVSSNTPHKQHWMVRQLH